MRQAWSPIRRPGRGLPISENGEYVETTVYNRNAMTPISFRGAGHCGGKQVTLILGPGAQARVDEQLNLIVDLPEEV